MPRILLLLLFTLPGCDSRRGIEGTVTFDGQPLAEGSITFVQTGDQTVREGAVIRDGKFTVVLPPGTYRVEVQARKAVGKRKQKGFDGNEEEVELTAEMIPERYNARSELTQVIESSTKLIELQLTSGNSGK